MQINLDELKSVGITIPQPVHFKIKDAKQVFEEAFNFFVPDFKYLKEYDEVVEWLSDNKGKGLAMFGDSGLGKSTILRQVLPVVFYQKLNKILKPVQSYKLNIDYKPTKLTATDDIGNEPKYNDFGNKIELLPLIIDQCEVNSNLLIIAGNLTGQNFVERYGQPVYDRVANICKVIKFNGGTLRI